MRSFPLAASAAVLTVLSLAACGPGAPGPTETPEPVVTVSPSSSPIPEPDPEPVAATCENLLSTSLAEYSAIGISGPGSYAEKLQSEGNAFYGFYEAGGVFCFVGEVEAYALYGWAPFDDAGWETIRTSLLSESWDEEVTDAGFLYTSVAPQPLSICYYRPNEFGGCAATSELLDEVFANAPA
jgi:hypothetical protein